MRMNLSGPTICLAVFLLLAAFTSRLQAQERLLPFQGQMTDQAGAVLTPTTPVTLTFRLYETPVGGPVLRVGAEVERGAVAVYEYLRGTLAHGISLAWEAHIEGLQRGPGLALVIGIKDVPALTEHLRRHGIDPGEIRRRYGAEGYGASI